MQEDKVAIVVLNYLNFEDTIECVDSILKNRYDIVGVVVVDNGSYNHSYELLIEEYRHRSEVYVIKSPRNLGFSRGNNLGIRFARKKLRADFVLVVNNDTVFTESDYIEKLVSNYSKGVGCIGSSIVLRDGARQGIYKEYISLKDTFIYLINMHSKRWGSSFDFPVGKGEMTEALHGSAIMFTPDFFKYYKGFYPRTFLYGEEAILFYMCKCKGLEQRYVADASIYHKEDQSSAMAFDNNTSIMNNYSYQSRKYLLLWALKWKILQKVL